MARGKVKIKRIENTVHQQVTFCKRRAGLLKKAKELSVLCDADIGIIIFSTRGKLYELATNGNMQGLIERYKKSRRAAQIDEEAEANHVLESQVEVTSLEQEIQLLQKGFRYIFGGGAENMTFAELHLLEKHLESWIYHIRSTKMQIMYQEIQLLKNKEGLLKAANEYLQGEEGLLKAANQYLQGEIMQQNGIYEIPPMITGFQYPLNIQNEIFQFQEFYASQTANDINNG